MSRHTAREENYSELIQFPLELETARRIIAATSIFKNPHNRLHANPYEWI